MAGIAVRQRQELHSVSARRELRRRPSKTNLAIVWMRADAQDP
jgi:hypothetical protein